MYSHRWSTTASQLLCLTTTAIQRLIVAILLRAASLYGARDAKEERHWRGSFEEIVQLIDRGFKTAPLASGV
jgi:hypothetical protein